MALSVAAWVAIAACVAFCTALLFAAALDFVARRRWWHAPEVVELKSRRITSAVPAAELAEISIGTVGSQAAALDTCAAGGECMRDTPEVSARSSGVDSARASGASTTHQHGMPAAEGDAPAHEHPEVGAAAADGPPKQRRRRRHRTADSTAGMQASSASPQRRRRRWPQSGTCQSCGSSTEVRSDLHAVPARSPEHTSHSHGSSRSLSSGRSGGLSAAERGAERRVAEPRAPAERGAIIAELREKDLDDLASRDHRRERPRRRRLNSRGSLSRSSGGSAETPGSSARAPTASTATSSGSWAGESHGGRRTADESPPWLRGDGNETRLLSA